MFGELQPLPLIVRGDAGAVQRIRQRQHLLIDEAADDLTVLENEGHFTRTHLGPRARPLPAGTRVAELEQPVFAWK